MSWLFQPAEDHLLTSWLFLKLLALVYFAAFFSIAWQIAGLAGPDGILPFQNMLENVYRQRGISAFWTLPTIFWISSSASALQGAALAGCLFSIMLLFNTLPRLSLVLLFVLYLSLYHAGQLFMNFQWDYLLLETGFLAIFLVNGPNRLLLIMLHWLLFRLRFLSGISKVLSEDPSWSNLTTLNYYFETQPLPHVGAWYAHQMPEWILKSATGLVLFSELIVPFFIFLSRPFRLTAAAITLVIQLSIIATSNHNFINLLTILLCLLLLDDRIVSRIIPQKAEPGILKQVQLGVKDTTTGRLTQLAMAGFIMVASLTAVTAMVTPYQPPASFRQVYSTAHNYGLGNLFHVFPLMQTERHELEIQGSNDGRQWKTYRFKYKPGPIDTKPAFIVPHQPRLDWMMWFVPTQHPMLSRWFDLFMRRLWQNEPSVTELLAHNPFPSTPPKYLRVLVYQYHFTSKEEKEQSGNWWKRVYLGEYPGVAPRDP